MLQVFEWSVWIASCGDPGEAIASCGVVPRCFGEAFASPEVGFAPGGVIRTNDPHSRGRQMVRLCVSHGRAWIDTHASNISSAVVRRAVAVRW